MPDSRNVVAEDTAERNRTVGLPGGYTFHAPIPSDYEGPALTFAVVRLGDHAHIDVTTGRAIRTPGGYDPEPWATVTGRGPAGHLIMQWADWLIFRAVLDAAPHVHIAEVEKPTRGQARHHAPKPRGEP